MVLLVNILLAVVVAAIGAIVTYLYLGHEGHDDEKGKYTLMIFLIIFLVLLFVIYENIVSVWVHSLFTSSAS